MKKEIFVQICPCFAKTLIFDCLYVTMGKSMRVLLKIYVQMCFQALVGYGAMYEFVGGENCNDGEKLSVSQSDAEGS